MAKQESDNSEDSTFIDKLNSAIDGLQQSIPTMVQNAKNVAINPTDQSAASRWREANKNLLNHVGQIRKVIQGDSPIDDNLRNLSLDQHSVPPPRPPLPSNYHNEKAPQRPPLPQQFETDDENDEIFNKSQGAMNQPIMVS